jgi:predicted phage terminase large subunit-like protein
VKSYFENDATGYRMSLSVGSQATGYRGDAVIVDDPINATDALSDLARAEVERWWDVVMSSRLNDLRVGARVVIMQRLHHQDLAGTLIERGGYEHVCLPSEFEPDRRSVTSLGWTDPRTEPDELLFPDRFPPAVITQAQQDLGPDAYASQHQQRPTPREGSFFQRPWFEIVDAVPAHASTRRCRAWDRAATEGAGDWTAGVKLARDPKGIYYVEDVVRARHGPGTRDALILQTAALDGTDCQIIGEQEPGSAGVDQAAAFVRMLAGYRVSTKPSTGSKTVRADPLASQAKAGNVKLVKGPWNAAFLAELSQFPLGGHDDQVDAAALAFHTLALGNRLAECIVL